MMRTLIGWTVGAACATLIVSGISALPVQGQDVKQERKDLETSRQQLRNAYRRHQGRAGELLQGARDKLRSNDAPK
jgi:hypothetical protein